MCDFEEYGDCHNIHLRCDQCPKRERHGPTPHRETNWFKLSGDARLGRCASERCGGQPTWRLEADGVGSNYCSGCREKISPSDPAPDSDAQRRRVREEDTQFAWVIERGEPSAPSYYAPTQPGEWTKDHAKACRFARKEDAEAIQWQHVKHGHLPVCDTRVCEHGWLAASLPVPDRAAPDSAGAVEREALRKALLHACYEYDAVEDSFRIRMDAAMTVFPARGQARQLDAEKLASVENEISDLVCKRFGECDCDREYGTGKCWLVATEIRQAIARLVTIKSTS